LRVRNRIFLPPICRCFHFLFAGSLPLELDFKQKLLALRSEPERLLLLVQYFEAVIPNIQRTAQARQRAGGNGHVH
jgi:hypothetical protein